MREVADLHDPFKAFLKKHKLPYIYHRPDKKSGITTGHPDFTVVRNNRCAMIEFKIGKNTLSPEQVRRCDELASAGCTVRVCYDLESAIEWVQNNLSTVSVLDVVRVNAPTKVADGALESTRPNGDSSDGRQSLYLTHNKDLGHVVVTKNPQGHMGYVRLAKPNDMSLPSAPLDSTYA